MMRLRTVRRKFQYLGSKISKIGRGYKRITDLESSFHFTIHGNSNGCPDGTEGILLEVEKGKNS